MRRTLLLREPRAVVYVALIVLFAPSLTLAQAHFAPGLANIRDYTPGPWPVCCGVQLQLPDLEFDG
jgi:hypothetical protein